MRDIAFRLELFVDEWLIDNMVNAQLSLHSPTSREVAVAFDAPWEGRNSNCVTVMKDEGRFRMYYRGLGADDDHSPQQNTSYAESRDGVHWEKPALGLYEFNGSRDNNIVWWHSPACHNFAPFKDLNPACADSQRYKAVGLDWESKPGGLIGLVSPDGLHWQELAREHLITDGAFDTHNVAFWDAAQGHYVAYIRDWIEGKVRTIRRSTSADFINWTSPEWLDFGPAPMEQLYTNAITPYFRAPHIYLGFPMRIVEERRLVAEHGHVGVSDAVFMSSRDGLRWDRRFLEAFIRPGLDRRNWTDRNFIVGWGILQTSPEEISLYWVENYDHPTCRARRGTLRLDGFVSIHAGYSGGEVLTRPLLFSGREMVINYSTSAVGSVRVEIQNAQGRPLPGYALADCREIYGDEIEHRVEFAAGPEVGSLAGRPVRLRFVMKDADLYSLRFRP
jgi:hypothetical protein